MGEKIQKVKSKFTNDNLFTALTLSVVGSFNGADLIYKNGSSVVL